MRAGETLGTALVKLTALAAAVGLAISIAGEIHSVPAGSGVLGAIRSTNSVQARSWPRVLPPDETQMHQPGFDFRKVEVPPGKMGVEAIAADGGPLEGLPVLFWFRDTTVFQEGTKTARVESVTGEDGRAYADLPTGLRYVDVVVGGWGRGYESVRGTVNPGTLETCRGFSTTLQKAGALTVPVRFADGTPASGMRVKVYGNRGWVYADNAVAGLARFPGLLPGVWHISVQDLENGYNELADVTVQVAEGMTRSAEIRLPRLGALEVRYPEDWDDEQGFMVRGTVTQPWSRDPMAMPGWVATPFGRVERLLPGTYHVDIQVPNAAIQRHEVKVSAGKTTIVRPKPITRSSIIRLVDAEGEPAYGRGRVRLSWDGGKLETESDSQGMIRVRGLGPATVTLTLGTEARRGKVVYSTPFEDVTVDIQGRGETVQAELKPRQRVPTQGK